VVALCLIFGDAKGKSGRLIIPALYYACMIIQWTPVTRHVTAARGTVDES